MRKRDVSSLLLIIFQSLYVHSTPVNQYYRFGNYASLKLDAITCIHGKWLNCTMLESSLTSVSSSIQSVVLQAISIVWLFFRLFILIRTHDIYNSLFGHWLKLLFDSIEEAFFLSFLSLNFFLFHEVVIVGKQKKRKTNDEVTIKWLLCE